MPQADEVIPTPLRRLGRCFITSKSDNNGELYRSLRSHLLYVCKNILGEISDKDRISDDALCFHTEQLRTHLPSMSVDLYCRMISDDIKINEKRAIASLFKQLSYDSCVDTLIPFRAVDIIIDFGFACQAGRGTRSSVLEFCYQQQLSRGYRCNY